MTDAAQTDFEQYLIIGLGGELFAIAVALVRDILDVGPMTPVPTAPAFVGHLINVRGNVAPLADLRLRLGLEASPPTIDSRVVVIEIEVDSMPALTGVLADTVREVARLDEVITSDVPRVGMKWRPEFVRLIGRREGAFVGVLDIDRIFAPRGRDAPRGLKHESNAGRAADRFSPPGRP